MELKSCKEMQLFAKYCCINDSKEIINISKKQSYKFFKTKNISKDNSSMYEVIKHCINFYKKNILFENIVLLELTSPIREPDDLNKAMKLFLNKK